MNIRVFRDFVSATAKASASAYCTGMADAGQAPHEGWPRACAVPNPGGFPAMPTGEITFNVNKDLNGYCAGVSYTEVGLNLNDCLTAYNYILDTCE